MSLADLGGPMAQVEVADSVEGLLKVFLTATNSDSGAFISYKGERLAW